MNGTIRDTLAKTGASIEALVAAFACVLNILNYHYNNGPVSPIFVTGFISLIFAYAWLRPQCGTCTPVINWMFTIAVMVQPSHAAIQGAGYGVATMTCLFVSTILMFTKSPRYGTVVLLISLAIMNINVNLIWENMNHEHYTAYEKIMYNIVAFMTWAVIYRLTGIMWDMNDRVASQTTYLDTALKVGKLGLVRRRYQPEDWQREMVFDEESDAIFNGRQNDRLIGVIQDFDEEGREVFLSTCAGKHTVRSTIRWKDSKWVDIERFIVDNESIWLVKDVTEEYEANKRLTENLDRFETVAESGEIVFVEVDLKTREVYANRFWRERWGYSEDERVGWDEFLQQRCSSKFRHHFNNKFHEVMITKKPTEDTLQATEFRNKDGKLSWHKIRISPVVENDKVTKIRLTNHDVTDLVEAQTGYAQALRQLEASIEGGQIGVFTHHLDTNTVEVNNHYRAMRKLPAEGEITFEQATQYMSPLDESLGTYDDVLKSHRKTDINKTTVVFDDGVDKRYQRLVSTPIHNALGELIAMTGTVFDITEEYEARQALEESQAKTEEFSAHLEESMAELEEKREQEKQMLAVLGHELRTPAAMLKMLIDDFTDLGDGKVPEAMASIDHLIKVLDDLKAISNPQLKLLKENESLQMCPTMDSIVQFVKPLAEGTNFTFDYTVHRRVPHKVKMSEQALRQIMTNLVKNAVKHSGGDHVSIDLANRVNKENHTVKSIITVSDNGRGIPVEERATIFDPFIRGKHTRAEGTGLGLSIIKGLVEQYNGTIEYQPNPTGRGAMFVIQMELEIDDTSPKYNSDYVNMLEGKKILVAEDNLTIQMLTKAMLEKRGATVVTVNNGREGIELLGKREYFNIIISDIFMPEMEGYEFVTMARAMGFSGPIIGATAAVLGEEIDRMIASGADVCLEKPLNVSKLNKELARLMS